MLSLLRNWPKSTLSSICTELLVSDISAHVELRCEFRRLRNPNLSTSPEIFRQQPRCRRQPRDSPFPGTDKIATEFVHVHRCSAFFVSCAVWRRKQYWWRAFPCRRTVFRSLATTSTLGLTTMLSSRLTSPLAFRYTLLQNTSTFRYTYFNFVST